MSLPYYVRGRSERLEIIALNSCSVSAWPSESLCVESHRLGFQQVRFVDVCLCICPFNSLQCILSTQTPTRMLWFARLPYFPLKGVWSADCCSELCLLKHTHTLSVRWISSEMLNQTQRGVDGPVVCKGSSTHCWACLRFSCFGNWTVSPLTAVDVI